MEQLAESVLQRLERMCEELDACPPEDHLVWRLNHKGVLGSYAPALLFTIRKLQKKATQQAERLENQAGFIENLDSAYHAEHAQYVAMKARALQAEQKLDLWARQARDLAADLERARVEIDRLTNELYICKHDLGRYD